MITSNIPSGTLVNRAKVELYDNSTLLATCTCDDRLVTFSVERTGANGKFFGFGICHKLHLSIIDLERTLTVTKGIRVIVRIGDGTNFDTPYPNFFVAEVERNEDTNEITITAYDRIYEKGAQSVSVINTAGDWPLTTIIYRCATAMGLAGVRYVGISQTSGNLALRYTDGANFDEEETLRDALNHAAEAAQFVYYLAADNFLVIKRPSKSGTPVHTITKEDYFNLTTGEAVRLHEIHHVTELGDNTMAQDNGEGVAQYIRENPFLNLRTDMATIMANAVAASCGTTITPFVCQDWLGNHCLEYGDKIAIETEDGGTVQAYVFDDVLTFDGTIAETTQWAYEESAEESPSNPVGLGEALNKTFARVDKAAKEITIYAGKTDAMGEQVAALQLNTDSISASVSSLETSTKEALDGLNTDVETLTREVALKMSAEDVQITIDSTLENGVEKVHTSTGFTFDEEGLKVSKSDSEMSTQITEDGMAVSKSGTVMLTANHEGVEATNLHARTYLIIGENSRLENYGSNRTGCFWIGGQ